MARHSFHSFNIYLLIWKDSELVSCCFLYAYTAVNVNSCYTYYQPWQGKVVAEIGGYSVSGDNDDDKPVLVRNAYVQSTEYFRLSLWGVWKALGHIS